MKDPHKIPSDKPFSGENCGLSRQERTDTPRNPSEPLPKVIAIDPEQKKI